MSNRYIFPSVARPSVRYVIYDGSHYVFGFDNGINPYVKSFDTLGDGEIQHTMDHVVGLGELEDFLDSFLRSVKGDRWKEFTEWWPRINEAEDLETIEFAHSVRYDENKMYRYYNLKERKISAAESKKNDRRWDKIESWYDGSPSAVHAISNPEKPHGIFGHYLWVVLMSKALNYTPSQEMELIDNAEYKSHMRIMQFIKLCNALIDSQRKQAHTLEAIERNIAHNQWLKEQKAKKEVA